jgi:hypothetical protein
MTDKVRTWRHSRKGLISGVVVKQTDEWTTIRLSDIHPAVAAGYGTVAAGGEELTFRTEFATEITDA